MGAGRRTTISPMSRNSAGARERSQTERLGEPEDCPEPRPLKRSHPSWTPSGVRSPRCPWPGGERPLPLSTAHRATVAPPRPGS